jgi:hypothetical protein
MGFYNGKMDRDYSNEFDKDDDKDYIVVGGRHSGKQYPYYSPAHWPMVRPIVTGSDPSWAMPYDTDNALEQVTNYIDMLRNTIQELEVRLHEAHEKIAGQEKFIEILQRQIKIAEKYIINDNGRDT